MKKLFLIFSLIGALFLTSCNPLRSSDLSSDKMMLSVIDAIEARDREALKGLFSEYIKQNTNLDAGIDYLFDYVQGEDIVYDEEANDMPVAGAMSHYGEGQACTEVRRYYRISVDGESYIIYIVYYSVNDLEPEKEGLHALRITSDAYMIENYYKKELLGSGDDMQWHEYVGYGDGLNQMSEGIFVPNGTIENFVGVLVTE